MSDVLAPISYKVDKPNSDSIDLIEDETIARKSCKYRAEVHRDLIVNIRMSSFVL